MAVAGRLALDLGWPSPVALALFEHPTAAAFARALGDSRPSGQPGDQAPGTRPWSGSQTASGFRFPSPRNVSGSCTRWTRRPPHYNVQLALRLTGDLRVDLLHEALLTVVTGHEVLRTVIGERDGRGQTSAYCHLTWTWPWSTCAP